MGCTQRTVGSVPVLSGAWLRKLRPVQNAQNAQAAQDTWGMINATKATKVATTRCII